MIQLHQDALQDAPCDPVVVENLIGAATSAMSRTIVPDQTTPSELLSAVFTLLDRTLRGVRKLQGPEERVHNAQEITRVLNEFIVDHGRIPN